MKKTLVAFMLFAAMFAAVPAMAADEKPNPMKQVEEDPSLPRVLIIGDSISIGYMLDTRKQLEGVANVQRPATNCGPTSRGLEGIDEWLGNKPWDVIHFNFGLHDLKYCDDKGTLVEVGKGHQQIPIEQYEKNLDTLVKRMKKTGATLIFATITPVPEGAAGRVPADAPRYNEAALKVMKENKVEVNDLYGFCLPQLDKLQLPANVHFKPEGSAKLAKVVGDKIKKALEERKKQ